MLGKLIKYEWKATAKLLIPLNIFLILISIAGRIMISFKIFNTENSNIFAVLCIMLYVMSIFVICVLTFVYLIGRFYKNFYSDEGYLMFTLPATPHQLLISKLLIAFIWDLINTIITIGSLLFLLSSDVGLKEAISQFPLVIKEMSEFLKITETGIYALIIFFIIVSILHQFLTFYVSISIGQLYSRHKLVGSGVAYIAIYIITSIISFAGMIILGYSPVGNTNNITDISFLYFSLAVTVVLSFIFYFVTEFLMKKHLNLD